LDLNPTWEQTNRTAALRQAVGL